MRLAGFLYSSCENRLVKMNDIGMIRIGDIIYFARIHHQTGIYDLCELHVRTVYDDVFVGVDKHTKQAFIVDYESPFIFRNRKAALDVVKEAEKQKKSFTVVKDDDD